MENYSIYLITEREKSALVDIATSVGANLTAVSGAGRGFLVCLEATPNQADTINLLFAGV